MKIGPIHSLGIMQGRLLPKYEGRYQAHPVGYWQEEFVIAADRNLDYIEFILDYNDADLNPLMTEKGVQEISDCIQKTGLGVRSVCADYFMDAPLHHADAAIAESSRMVLQTLVANASKLGIRDIVIPCVDQSSLKEESDKNRFIEVLNSLRNYHEQHHVNLALETDLNADDFARLLDRLPSALVTVNYDTGNSASLGFDMADEFRAYASRISDIHIKDRKRNAGSVMLGTGDTNFQQFFSLLNNMRYEGIFVMQVYRDDEGVAVFDQQLDWLHAAANNSMTT